MCRMLVTTGKFSIPLLLKDFSLMAEDKNENHKNNQSQKYEYGDGRGIADEFKIQRSS